MDKITIHKLEVYAHHGVFAEENVLGQKFVFSAVMYLDTRRAGRRDELEASVHYGEVCHLIQKYATEHTVKLLECLVEGLAEEILLSFPLICAIDLKVEKPWAPIGLPLETVSVEIHREWHHTYIALGSNMGDEKRYLDDAVKKLDQRKDCQVQKVSGYIVTKPYGGVEQDDFVNGALELKTLLSPEELLVVLHEIEAEAKRERTIHWGPRTLDLDILFYDDAVIDTEELHIPHIDMANRDFVLIPMAQIAPWKRHPYLNKTIEQLLKDLNEQA